MRRFVNIASAACILLFVVYFLIYFFSSIDGAPGYKVVAIDGGTRVIVRFHLFSLNEIVVGPKVRSYSVIDRKIFVARSLVIFKNSPDGINEMKDVEGCEYYEINTEFHSIKKISKELARVKCSD